MMNARFPDGTMRAAVLAQPGRIEFGNIARPRPGRNEVRVRIEACGVCASNLEPWKGRPWFTYPFAPGAPGHEATGWIDEAGDDVSGWQPGERVALLSYHAYAEYDVAPADALVRLPAELDGQLLPGEPLGCAMNIFARSGIEAGATVAIVGVGFLGALLTQLTVRAGARTIALSQRPYALEVALAMGAAETLSLADSSA